MNNKWYRASLLCGFAPLITGITIFVSWLITRVYWLEIAGIFIIIAGLVLFILGLLFLGAYYFKGKSNNSVSFKRVATSLAILVLNFPVAMFAVTTAINIMSTYSIMVKNNTPQVISDFTLIAKNKQYEFPVIKPQETITKDINFKHEGSVNYRFTFENEVQNGVMFGYVAAGLGQKTVRLISSDGNVNIENEI